MARGRLRGPLLLLTLLLPHLTQVRGADNGPATPTPAGLKVSENFSTAEESVATLSVEGDVKVFTDRAEPVFEVGGDESSPGSGVRHVTDAGSTIEYVTVSASTEKTVGGDVAITEIHGTETSGIIPAAPANVTADAITTADLVQIKVQVSLIDEEIHCPPCPDPHQNCSSHGHCECEKPDYKRTLDPDTTARTQCRNASGGFLGDPCNDVSNCYYKIRHAECSRGQQETPTCSCSYPYIPHGETFCYSNPTSWLIAIKTAGITVMVLAFGFFLAFAFKACTKSRLRRRVPWLRRSSDVSFRSEDFYAAAAGFAIADRPPSYSEEDSNKPPNYEELFPGAQEGGIDNTAFAPDLPTTSIVQSTDTTAADAVQPSSTVRRHRRGLSGPAALSLGSDGSVEAEPTTSSRGQAAGAVPRVRQLEGHICSPSGQAGTTDLPDADMVGPSADAAPQGAALQPPVQGDTVATPAEVWHDIEL